MNEPALPTIAELERRLRSMRPIWHRGQMSLYRSSDGYYVIDDQTPGAATRYIGITQDGTVVDMAGLPTNDSDVEVAIQALGGAGLSQLRALVISWPRRPHT